MKIILFLLLILGYIFAGAAIRMILLGFGLFLIAKFGHDVLEAQGISLPRFGGSNRSSKTNPDYI